MKAVFLKELRQYWNSLTGAVFLAAYALMIGYQFYVGNLLAQNGSVSRLFESVLSMLMFFIPILTMRLFAEEKKMHTDQLVFTAPVSDAQIMAGKFGAAWLVFGVGQPAAVMGRLRDGWVRMFSGTDASGELYGAVPGGRAVHCHRHAGFCLYGKSGGCGDCQLCDPAGHVVDRLSTGISAPKSAARRHSVYVISFSHSKTGLGRV